MFSANQTPTAQQKDTVKNVEATGVFCWQLATYELREHVNSTSEQLPYGIDEFEHAGLEKEDASLNSISVKGKKTPLPMVKASPIKFECTHYTTLRLPGNPPMVCPPFPPIPFIFPRFISCSPLLQFRLDQMATPR